MTYRCTFFCPNYRFNIVSNTAYCFDMSFMSRLLATGPVPASKYVVDSNTNIFNYDTLILPFYGNDQTSLFVVSGLKVFTSKQSKLGCTHPCIVHLNPHGNQATHDAGLISNRIRDWLNVMYRKTSQISLDRSAVPFHKRSFPFHRSKGKCFLFM